MYIHLSLYIHIYIYIYVCIYIYTYKALRSPKLSAGCSLGDLAAVDPEGGVSMLSNTRISFPLIFPKACLWPVLTSRFRTRGSSVW